MEKQVPSSTISEYWNEHIHDLEIVTHPIGTGEFFKELDDYRYTKLHYLPKLVDFSAYHGKYILEVGCGVGIDLVHFARAGAVVTGIDLSQVAIDLAQKNIGGQGLEADLLVMDGERMGFEDNLFDFIYAHGVLQYTSNPQRMVAEIHRLLKPDGEAILMVYNRWSWLNLLSKTTGVPLEHEDAPVFEKFSLLEFKGLLSQFKRVRILPERFPVETQLHQGLKAKLYNGVFVGIFNLAPKFIVRPLGWHLMAFVVK
jgi:SAM-dependent methyltransferase